MKTVYVVSYVYSMFTIQQIIDTTKPINIIHERREKKFNEDILATNFYDSLMKKSRVAGPGRILTINDTTNITQIQFEARLEP